MSLAGQTYALAEGRQQEELAALLTAAGATPLRCPLISIVDPPDLAPVHAWLDRAVAGTFTHFVFLTGEGFARLTEQADARDQREAWLAAVATAVSVTRGPKPVKALRAYGLSPTHVADAPTSDGVAATLRRLDLVRATVGVQLYNADLPAPLAAVVPAADAVLPYVYAPAADAERVADVIEQLATGTVAGMVFTSAPQIDRLFAVAAERTIEPQLRAGLDRGRVAAVGPIVADALRARGVRVDVVPAQGFVMKNLVKQLERAAGGQ